MIKFIFEEWIFTNSSKRAFCIRILILGIPPRIYIAIGIDFILLRYSINRSSSCTRIIEVSRIRILSIL